MSPDVLLECPRTSFRDVLRVNVTERVWHSPPPNPPHPPLTRSTERIFMRPQILGNVLNTFSPERFTAAPLCLIYFQPFFLGRLQEMGQKGVELHTYPLCIEKMGNGSVMKVDERRPRSYCKNTFTICYLDDKDDCKRYYHFQFINFSFDWLNLIFII